MLKRPGKLPLKRATTNGSPSSGSSRAWKIIIVTTLSLCSLLVFSVVVAVVVVVVVLIIIMISRWSFSNFYYEFLEFLIELYISEFILI